MTKFADEMYVGLGVPTSTQSLYNMLTDEDSSPRKYNRTLSFATTAEMYQALQDLIAHKDLPFNGSMSAALRHAAAVFIEVNDQFLSDDQRTIFRSLMEQQRRLTRERIIITIDEVIDQQVDHLRFWSHRGKWNLVARDIARFVNEIEEYREPEWREAAAEAWLHNAGVKQLMRLWADKMHEESPESWRKVGASVKALELYLA